MADNGNQQGGGIIDLRSLQQSGGNPANASGGTTNAAQTGTGGGQAGTSQGGDPSLFSKFDIPETVRKQYPDLIPLILQTESMNDDERQYWFQILPIMTEEQVAKLREILINEHNQLQQLDKEYQQELKRINDKHVAEWKEFEAKEKRQKLQAAESTAQSQEAPHEEDLLKKLQEL